MFVEGKALAAEGSLEITFSEWHHLTCSVPDFGNEDSLKVYYDGSHYGTHNEASSRETPTRSSRVIVGRAFTDQDDTYSSVELDELLFFNRALEEHHVQALYQQHA